MAELWRVWWERRTFLTPTGQKHPPHTHTVMGTGVTPAEVEESSLQKLPSSAIIPKVLSSLVFHFSLSSSFLLTSQRLTERKWAALFTYRLNSQPPWLPDKSGGKSSWTSSPQLSLSQRGSGVPVISCSGKRIAFCIILRANHVTLYHILEKGTKGWEVAQSNVSQPECSSNGWTIQTQHSFTGGQGQPLRQGPQLILLSLGKCMFSPSVYKMLMLDSKCLHSLLPPGPRCQWRKPALPGLLLQNTPLP